MSTGKGALGFDCIFQIAKTPAITTTATIINMIDFFIMTVYHLVLKNKVMKRSMPLLNTSPTVIACLPCMRRHGRQASPPLAASEACGRKQSTPFVTVVQTWIATSLRCHSTPREDEHKVKRLCLPAQTGEPQRGNPRRPSSFWIAASVACQLILAKTTVRYNPPPPSLRATAWQSTLLPAQ